MPQPYHRARNRAGWSGGFRLGRWRGFVRAIARSLAIWLARISPEQTSRKTSALWLPALLILSLNFVGLILRLGVCERNAV